MTIEKTYTGGESDKYRFPILDPDDYDEDDRWDTEISAFLEKRCATIADNNLKGAAKSFIATDKITRGRGVISETEMTFSYDDDLATVSLEELECVINFIYVQAFDLSWSGLVKGETYYLFVRLIEDERDGLTEDYQSSREKGDLLTLTKTGIAESNLELLLAKVDVPNDLVYGAGGYGEGAYGSS